MHDNDFFGARRGHDTDDSPRRRYTVHPVLSGAVSALPLSRAPELLAASGGRAYTHGMSHPATHRPMSVEEYLRFEEASPIRHEFVGGEVYAMAGGTLRHNQIALNIGSRLHAAARGGPCRVYVNDVKLRIGSDFYYPDLILDCEPHDGRAVFVAGPCLVVEVLSDCTRRTDRREKLAAYERVPALRSYLLVEQNEERAIRHWRSEGGAWQDEEVSAAAGVTTIRVPCLDVSLALAEIYEEVDTPPRERHPLRVREE